MAGLSEHASAMGKHGAKKKWEGMKDTERKKIMELVRAAKKRRPSMNDNFAIANAVMRRENQRNEGR